MALKYLTGIDLNSNELSNVQIHNVSSDPATGVDGQIVFNTTDDKIKVYYDSAWNVVGTSYVLPTATTTTLGGVRIDNSTIKIDSGVISLKNLGITNVHISATAAIALTKLQDIADDRLIGRIGTGSSGATQTYNAGSVRTFLNVANGATANDGALADLDQVDTAQIVDDAVTGPKIADDSINNLHIKKSIISGQTAKTALSNADILLIGDSDNTNELKKTSVGDLETYMQSNLTFNSTDVDVSVTNLKSRLSQIDSDVTIGNASTVDVSTSGDLTVGGNLIVQGSTTTVESTTVTIEDHHFKVATSNNTTNDFGFYGRYGSSAKFAGFTYDVSNEVWKCYDDANSEPGNTTFSPTNDDGAVLSNFQAQKGIFSGLVLGSTDLQADFTELNNVRSGANVASIKPADGDGFLIKDISDTSGGAAGTIKMTSGSKVFAYMKDNMVGGISTVVVSDLTASRALVSDGSGKISVSSVTSTQLSYVDATSSIQTQLNAKQATITGAASTVVSSDLTANAVVITNDNGKIEASGVSSTELLTLAEDTAASASNLSDTDSVITNAGSVTKKTTMPSVADYVNEKTSHVGTISGDSTTTAFVITHDLSTRYVIVQVVDFGDAGTGATYETVYTDVERNSTSQITVTFTTAPSDDQDYKVLITKCAG